MKNHHFDKLELSSYFTNDISKEKSVEIKVHLKNCPECSDFITSLSIEKEKFLNSMPFEKSDDNFPSSHHQKNLLNFIQSKKFYSIAATLALMTTILFFQIEQFPKHTINNIKGGNNFQLFVQTVNGDISERNSSIYHPNERIQICYSSSDKGYLIFLSMDSSGNISRYFSPEKDSSQIIKLGAIIPLPNSIRLDNYIGQERLIMILSKEKLSVYDVEKKFKNRFDKMGLEKINLDFGNEFEIISRIIEKENE